ncbi:hypothetical protein JZ751_004941 [Albula glossodonta]|uniref:Uncharacterized protein n=1 Tax=Albula glossodonta TaxID=121402 RepID=A0A8T2P4D5_9TELE|nr:hypothetical protein JZ751_004941 [Albula glossodonta]
MTCRDSITTCTVVIHLSIPTNSTLSTCTSTPPVLANNWFPGFLRHHQTLTSHKCHKTSPQNMTLQQKFQEPTI